MTTLTATEIDRELARRTGEIAAMTATLMELDDHPGLVHVRRYPPAGATALQWAVIESSLARLWEDLGRATTILNTARALQSGRSKLSDTDRCELTELLCGRPLAVTGPGIPLGQRQITDPPAVAQNVGLADIVDRMSAAYPAVVGFADAIDAIDSLIAARLGPAQKFLDDAHVAGPKELVELLRMSATDPLSLTTGRVEHLIAVIDRGVEQLLSEAATLAALQDNWRDELDATAAQLDDLRNLTRQLFEVCTRAAQAVKVGPLPLHPNAEPGLRIELEAIVARSTSNPDPVALLALRQRIVTALRIAGDDERLAQGLLDRRGELKGRLAVYQAKAARLGLGEDRELLASGRIAAGLLSRRPCDLGAVTRAVKDFQQMIAHRQGAPS